MKNAKIFIKKDVLATEMERKNIVSITELAREIGVSESTLSLIMSGKRNPGTKVIGLMLAYFNCTFEWLFFYQNKLTKVNKSA